MIKENYQNLIKPAFLLLLAAIVSFPTLSFYSQVNGMWISYAAMLTLPVVFYIKSIGNLSIRFGVLAAICLVAFYFIPSHLILLFGFYSLCFLVVESFIGKLNKLAFILMILASPIAYYLFEIFGFPIRLKLTEWASQLLNLCSFNSSTEGNILLLDGQYFSVDPVCMGLNMAMTSMIASIILISFYEKQQKRSFSNLGLVMSISSALILVVFSNLIRIVLIIIFNAAPETFLHEGIGLVAMMIGVLLPLYFLLSYFSKWFSKKNLFEPIKNKINQKFKISLIGILLLGFLTANHTREFLTNEKLNTSSKLINIEGYEKEVLTFNGGTEVLKYQLHEKLIYIKSQAPQRITNHNPLICWQGSGFEIKNERTIEVGDRKVIFAEMINTNETYFTAWWFDNGKYKTIGNLDWRWKAINDNQPFYLINVASKDFSSLYMEVDWLIDQNLFNKS